MRLVLLMWEARDMRFLLAGLGGWIVCVAVYGMLISISIFDVRISYAAAFLGSYAITFVMQRMWAFAILDPATLKRHVMRYASKAILLTACGEAILIAGGQYYDVWYLPAISAFMIPAALSLLIAKYWVFKNYPPHVS